MYLVYKHTSPSGKSYIGLTNDYTRRSGEHQTTSGCRLFHYAIKKYGWDNFLHEVLYSGLTLNQASYREQQSINEYATMSPHGYNLTSGGEGRSPSHEVRDQISAASRGRKLTDEHKQKLSVARRRNNTPEMRALQSHNSTGRRHGEAAKQKMSANGKNKGALSYKVTNPAGESFDIINLKQFCDINNLTVTAMRRTAQGTLNIHKGGWYCRYA